MKLYQGITNHIRLLAVSLVGVIALALIAIGNSRDQDLPKRTCNTKKLSCWKLSPPAGFVHSKASKEPYLMTVMREYLKALRWYRLVRSPENLAQLNEKRASMSSTFVTRTAEIEGSYRGLRVESVLSNIKTVARDVNPRMVLGQEEINSITELVTAGIKYSAIIGKAIFDEVADIPPTPSGFDAMQQNIMQRFEGYERMLTAL